jgi:sec-independent protein translocase protein TatC
MDPMPIGVEERVNKFAGEESEARMTFGEHIEELRGRLFKSILFLILIIIVALVFYKELAEFIIQPHLRAMRHLYPDKSPDTYRLISGSYGAPILAMLKLTFIVALFVASPFVGYQMWAFVSAGLYSHEKKYVTRFAPISFVLFVIGCAFGYYVLVPYCLYGLGRMIDPNLVAPTNNFSDYLNLVMTLTIILGGVFQLPLLMVFFAKVGLIKPSTYNKWRRGAIICNVVFAAVITPPDVVTMIMVAIPMLLLYEVGVVVSFLVAPSSSKPPAAKA